MATDGQAPRLVCEGTYCLSFNVGERSPDKQKDIQVNVHWHQNKKGEFRTLRCLELIINGATIVEIYGGVL